VSNNVRLGRWSSRRLRPIANTRQYLCSFWAAYVLPQRSTNVGLASRERSLGRTTKIDTIGHLQTFTPPTPSYILPAGFVFGGIER